MSAESRIRTFFIQLIIKDKDHLWDSKLRLKREGNPEGVKKAWFSGRWISGFGHAVGSQKVVFHDPK